MSPARREPNRLPASGALGGSPWNKPIRRRTFLLGTSAALAAALLPGPDVSFSAVQSQYFKVAGSPWNTPLPVDVPLSPNNAAYVADLQRMELASGNAGGYSISRDAYSSPIYEVTNAQPRVPVTLYNGVVPDPPWRDTSLRHQLAWRFKIAGVPIPDDAVVAKGTDQHMVVINVDTGEYWEFWKMQRDTRNPGWSCAWGGWIANHHSNIGQYQDWHFQPNWSSRFWGATATSLPLAAGMGTDEELAAGVVPHTLHCVLPQPNPSLHVWPAQRGDGYAGGVIPEGSRFRVRPDFDVSTLSSPKGAAATRSFRAVAQALQVFGAIITDRSAPGSPISFRFRPTAGVNNFAALGGAWHWELFRTLNSADMEFISTTYRPT